MVKIQHVHVTLYLDMKRFSLVCMEMELLIMSASP